MTRKSLARAHGPSITKYQTTITKHQNQSQNTETNHKTPKTITNHQTQSHTLHLLRSAPNTRQAPPPRLRPGLNEIATRGAGSAASAQSHIRAFGYANRHTHGEHRGRAEHGRGGGRRARARAPQQVPERVQLRADVDLRIPVRSGTSNRPKPSTERSTHDKCYQIKHVTTSEQVTRRQAVSN